jgi:hypothetical protein
MEIKSEWQKQFADALGYQFDLCPEAELVKFELSNNIITVVYRVASTDHLIGLRASTNWLERSDHPGATAAEHAESIFSLIYPSRWLGQNVQDGVSWLPSPQ